MLFYEYEINILKFLKREKGLKILPITLEFSKQIVNTTLGVACLLKA